MDAVAESGPVPVRVPMVVGGAEHAGTRLFGVRDPGRFDEVVATVAEGDPEVVDAAVRAARRAGAGWADAAVESRVDRLAAAIAPLEADEDRLAELLSRENGGTLSESRMDLMRGGQLFRDLLARAPRFLAPEEVDDAGARLVRERRPVGVTALIVPWNSPIVLTMSKLAPALVAGNTVVVKPSPLAPAALGLMLARIAAALPAGVLNVVHGDTPVGEAMVTHPDVRKVSFTGSVEVGRRILAAAAAQVRNVSMELGGNDPAVLLDDVDVAAVAPQLCRGAYARAGQVCFAVKRVYVPRSRHDELVEALCAELDWYRVGHGLDQETTFGPLIIAAARTRVRGLVDAARAAGATVLERGAPTASVEWDRGHYLLPSVVTGLGQDHELVAGEQFGPVLPIVGYDGVDEAVALANDSEFGLCSSVWSADVERAAAVARRIEAGVTFVNGHTVSSLSFDVPFGGVRQSGIGRERTELGLREYVEEHAVRLVP